MKVSSLMHDGKYFLAKWSENGRWVNQKITTKSLNTNIGEAFFYFLCHFLFFLIYIIYWKASLLHILVCSNLRPVTYCWKIIPIWSACKLRNKELVRSGPVRSLWFSVVFWFVSVRPLSQLTHFVSVRLWLWIFSVCFGSVRSLFWICGSVGYCHPSTHHSTQNTTFHSPRTYDNHPP